VARAERRLADASAARRYVSEATRASRLYWWTAEYGLVGRLEAPRIYGAGLLSSIGESTHCFSDEVAKLPLSAAAADVDYDITRMQPQLFVARELSQLSEVVEDLARTLSFRRGGDHGLRVAQRARTVNHLVLADGIEVTGIVAEVVDGPRPVAPELATALAVLHGPTLVSRSGKALGPPEQLPAVVAFGEARVPPDGSFCLSFASGLALSGRIANGVASELRASLGGRELPIPPSALLLASPALSAVVGGPGDPGAWDWHFGAAVKDEEAEGRARAHRAKALSPLLADLYRAVRSLREGGRIDAARLAELTRAARGFPDEWLLRTELEELSEQAAPGVEAAAR
jgi:phenylalanine-4-hydroxylase